MLRKQPNPQFVEIYLTHFAQKVRTLSKSPLTPSLPPSELVQVDTLNPLVVTLDPHLTFTHHVNKVVQCAPQSMHATLNVTAPRCSQAAKLICNQSFTDILTYLTKVS